MDVSSIGATTPAQPSTTPLTLQRETIQRLTTTGATPQDGPHQPIISDGCSPTTANIDILG